MESRLESMKKNALRFRPALGTSLKYAPNTAAAAKVRKLMALYVKTFGPMSLADRLKSFAVRMLAIRENYRIKKEGTVLRQPPTNRVEYPDRTANSEYLEQTA
jgi:hypothetical protein